MATPDNLKTYTEVSKRLTEIVEQVRSRDTSLEQSLDLFDEAIALGAKAVDLVDKGEFSAEEEAQLLQEDTASSSQPMDGGEDVPEAQEQD